MTTLPDLEPAETERDIYEVANQLEGYVGPDTPEPLAQFLLCEGKEAAKLADEIVRLRAARSTVPEAGKAVVKPLEWRAGSRKCQRAQAALGFYEIEPQGPDRFGLFINYHAVKATFASWDEAKAAAQRDFEQCILSALASVPAPSGAGELCEDCPPVGYPTDTTRCLPCPRRATPQAVPAEDIAREPKFLEGLSQEALADLLREEFRESARRAETILDLRRKLEEAREALHVIATGSGYEWSETREQLHRIVDAAVECANNALRTLSGASE